MCFLITCPLVRAYDNRPFTLPISSLKNHQFYQNAVTNVVHFCLCLSRTQYTGDNFVRLSGDAAEFARKQRKLQFFSFSLINFGIFLPISSGHVRCFMLTAHLFVQLTSSLAYLKLQHNRSKSENKQFNFSSIRTNQKLKDFLKST